MQFRDGLMKLNSRLAQSWNYRFKWMKEAVIMKYKSCPHCGAKVKTENDKMTDEELARHWVDAQARQREQKAREWETET